MHTFGNIRDFLESGNLEIWKLPGIEWFWPISMYWVFFPLSFCHWPWFWAQNFKIQIVQKFFQKFSGNVEIFWNLLFRANSNILSIISTQFWSLKSIFNSEFWNSVSPENFPQLGYHFHSVLVTEINFEFKKNTVDGLELARIGLK